MSGLGRGRKAFDKRTIQASFTGHLTGLPQDILALFQPGQPLSFLPPVKKTKKDIIQHKLADCIDMFDEPTKTSQLDPAGKLFVNEEYRHQVRLIETILEKKARIKEEKSDLKKAKLVDKLVTYNPFCDPNVEGDPLKTLFIARLPRKVTEWKLLTDFEEFGPVRRIRIVTDKLSGKPRGYAFLEFEQSEDMKRAYKMGSKRSIEGKRIIVDIERGRSVAGWTPRRLGGGLGIGNKPSSQIEDKPYPIKSSSLHCRHGRDLPPKTTTMISDDYRTYRSVTSSTSRSVHMRNTISPARSQKFNRIRTDYERISSHHPMESQRDNRRQRSEKKITRKINS